MEEDTVRAPEIVVDVPIEEIGTGEPGDDINGSESLIEPTPLKTYTTVAVDIYGRWYVLSHEHPSWEQEKKNKGKKNTGFERCIVKNAFTCEKERAMKMREKTKGKKKR